jgi:hypothetical protein
MWSQACWRLLTVVAALVPVLVGSCGVENRADGLKLGRVRARDPVGMAQELEARGLDVLEGGVRGDSLDLIFSEKDLVVLRSMRLAVEVLQEGGAVAPADPLAAFLRYDQIVERMRTVALAHPAIARLVDVTENTGTRPTAEGRHIFGVRISDNIDSREDEPAFLLVSAHHAREIATPLIALEAIERLTAGYGNDGEIKRLVDGYETWIIPVWNPDGYEYVFSTERFWRKNRQPIGETVGVDLNRNYPFDWDGNCPGAVTPDDELYRGPAPASEAETQTMVRLSEAERFAKVIDHHSYGRYVNWGYACLEHPFDQFWSHEAAAIAMAAGYTDGRRPPAHGMHHEFQIAHFGTYSFLIESGLAFQPQYQDALAEAARVWPANLLMLMRPISISGHIVDAKTAAAIEAEIVIDDVRLTNGERITSGGPFGRFDVILPPGTHSLAFSAAGYGEQRMSVEVTESSAEAIWVAMRKLEPDASAPPGRGVPVDVAPAEPGSGDAGLTERGADGCGCKVGDGPRSRVRSWPPLVGAVLGLWWVRRRVGRLAKEDL